MPTHEPRVSVWPTIFVGAVLAAYVCAYYGSVRPVEFIGPSRVPAYRDEQAFEQSNYRPFFAPIHWLDRRIRPHIWDPKP